MFDLRNNLFTLCANHVANENLFFSTSHFPFLLFLCLTVSLFFHLGFHRKCPAEQTNDNTHKKKRSKTTHKKLPALLFLIFGHWCPSLLNSSLFLQSCFAFVFFVCPKENKKENNSDRKKNGIFQLNDSDGEEWRLWSVIQLVRQTKEKNRCLWELQKPIALYDGFDL